MISPPIYIGYMKICAPIVLNFAACGSIIAYESQLCQRLDGSILPTRRSWCDFCNSYMNSR